MSAEVIDSLESADKVLASLPVEHRKLVTDFINFEFNLYKAAQASSMPPTKASSILNSGRAKSVITWFMDNYAASPSEILALMTLHARIDISDYINIQPGTEAGTVDLAKL
ncbi:MAG: hypothetical protein ACRDBG_20800, partial [Waterburya sp.]